MKCLVAAVLFSAFISPAFAECASGYSQITVPLCQQNAATGVQAIPANTFLNSLGANTHIDQGNPEAPYEAEFTFTGIRHARDGGGSAADVTAFNALHANTISSTFPGVTTVIGVSPTTALSSGRPMAAAGSLWALEGPNEPNNFGFTYNGVNCSSASYVGCAQYQRDLYAAVKGDSALTNFPVFNVSEIGAEPDNSGLQCQILDSSCPGAAAVTLMPQGTKFNDYMNAHNYIQGNIASGGVIDNMAWQAADPECAGCPWVSAWASWGQTWAHNFQGYVHGTGAGGITNIPRVTTETGWGSEPTLPTGIGLEPEARLYMNIYLAQFKRGWFFTAIYQMVDSQGGGGQSGFFTSANAAKPAATYMHNLTTVIADKTDFAAGKLDYTIPSEPANVHDILLQKANGTFYLVIWDERKMGSGSDAVAVNLGAAANVKVYDTTVGTSPVNTLTNVTSVPLTMTDHPMIVQVGP